MTEDTNRKPEGPKKYAVFIDDNFHYGDGSASLPRGSYKSYAKAVQAAKRIVDDSLAELYEKGMNADELCKRYILFGDDPYIVPHDKDHPNFSARDYASERYDAICKQA